VKRVRDLMIEEGASEEVMERSFFLLGDMGISKKILLLKNCGINVAIDIRCTCLQWRLVQKSTVQYEKDRYYILKEL
jgi:hypothetical protein